MQFGWVGGGGGGPKIAVSFFFISRPTLRMGSPQKDTTPKWVRPMQRQDRSALITRPVRKLLSLSTASRRIKSWPNPCWLLQ